MVQHTRLVTWIRTLAYNDTDEVIWLDDRSMSSLDVSCALGYGHFRGTAAIPRSSGLFDADHDSSCPTTYTRRTCVTLPRCVKHT